MQNNYGPSTRAFAGLSCSLRTLAGMVGCVLASLAGPASATTADGTLITNVATGTYGSVGVGAPYFGADYAVSYAATQTVLVATPSIALQKTANPSIECSGGTVTFCIWAVNTSSLTSAFNVYLNDKFPDQMSYVALGQSLWTGTAAPSAIMQGWGSEPILPVRIWGVGAEPTDGSVSSGGYYYLRWVVSMIGPNKSAMVCYKARIL